MPITQEDIRYIVNGGEFEATLNIDSIPVDTTPQSDHYRQTSIEAIEGIKGSMTKEEYQGFLKGNTLKYLWRYNYKDSPLKDLKKARDYLDWLIESVEEEE